MKKRNKAKNINLTDFANIYIVNEHEIEYFTKYYTKQIINKIGRNISKNSRFNSLSYQQFNDKLIQLPSLTQFINNQIKLKNHKLTINEQIKCIVKNRNFQNV
ncbi:hypothetical protein [Campylobacter sp. LR264d]|uniref:hypothetical protein n=1 Tax=Campylobacter sp. LR264d TaxID=2593544 RepID=UPI00168146D9|nr:hypothetical protein [Campylobacter sp. LR264d]